MNRKDLHTVQDKNNHILYDDKPVDVSTEVNFIWSIANKLRGPYKSDKYKDVIIPMVIIRRFECALADTKSALLEKYRQMPQMPPQLLCRLSGHSFYNTSEFDLAELVNDADHLASNFKSYILGFSANVQDIINSLDFDKQINKMDENNRLLSVVKAFSELDLDPKTIDNIKMGYIFEDLIRRFSENAEAGDHYTGRDIIKTMVSVLLAKGCDDITQEGKIITVLDQACGTGGMLSTSYNYIKQRSPSADVRLFGQEINPESYAICLAEMMIKGQHADNVHCQDTMMVDCFADTKMRFVIENPPFGTAWGGKDAGEGVKNAVLTEAAKPAEQSRFPAGLPGSSDMQLLFVQSAVDKMDEHQGRAAIIENGSPLFTGGTSSGESQIRRWLLQNDLLEAIIALPTDLFYNTGIATYIWILSKCKSAKRRGKVQLIDASSIYHPLRKSLGNKRNEITAQDRQQITQLYTDFVENDLCRIFDNEDFMYREYTVMQPLQRSYIINEERIEKFSEQKESRSDVLEILTNNKSDKKYNSPEEFMPVLKKLLKDLHLDKKTIDKIAEGLSKMDKTAVIQRDKKGNIIYDKETKDIEIVPYKENIDDYMKREVLPHVPDAKAFFEEDLSKKKPIIKTGAEIPFTRYFYKYQQPVPSQTLQAEFVELENELNQRIAKLFK